MSDNVNQRARETHHGNSRRDRKHPVVLFDGECALCSWWVKFVLRRDPGGVFQFAPLQSGIARALLGLGKDDEVPLGSVILVEAQGIYRESTAALRIFRRLSGGWPLFYGLIVIPTFVRDPVYRWVARHRLRWFGRADACAWFDDPAWSKRLLVDPSDGEN